MDSERELIARAKEVFKEKKHDGVKGRSEHDYICGWLDKAIDDYRKEQEELGRSRR